MTKNDAQIKSIKSKLINDDLDDIINEKINVMLTHEIAKFDRLRDNYAELLKHYDMSEELRKVYKQQIED